jgi:predicted acyltransferase
VSATAARPTSAATPDDRSADTGSGRPAGGGQAPARERLLSLDVFRGMTVAGMLLVNNPGTWSAIYPPLGHAEWHGWTPTDLIFPFFLFIVGITTQLSLGVRRAKGDPERTIVRQVLRRGAMIFLFGLFLSWFPGFQWGAVAGNPDPSFGERVLYRLEHLRIMGVLQRIGIAYVLAALLTLRTTLRQQVGIVAALLVGYWIAMTLVPVPDGGALGATVLHVPGATLDAWIDRAVLGVDHLWAGGGGRRDPEGLFSTLPAVATAMLGNFAGRWIGQRERPMYERLSGLFAAGALAMVVGLIWHWVFPINKSLWTSSYVVFTGGMACVTLATCMWVVDVHGVRWWTKPFVIYGVNPMIAFLGSGLMARLIYSVLKVSYEGKEVSLQSAIFRSVYAPWLSPVNASLAFALSFVLFWLAVLWVLYRRNIILKV